MSFRTIILAVQPFIWLICMIVAFGLGRKAKNGRKKGIMDKDEAIHLYILSILMFIIPTFIYYLVMRIFA